MGQEGHTVLLDIQVFECTSKELSDGRFEAKVHRKHRKTHQELAISVHIGWPDGKKKT